MYLNNKAFLNTPEDIRARNARQLTDALMLQMRIFNDYSLVPYLSPGTNKTNKAALMEWVQQHVDLNEVITPSVISHTAAELADYLLEQTEYY
jgi:hypothetical protein